MNAFFDKHNFSLKFILAALLIFTTLLCALLIAPAAALYAAADVETDEDDADVAVTDGEGDADGEFDPDDVASDSEEVAYDPDEEPDLACGEDYYGRFLDAGISINVYNWGEYIADGSDDSLDINGLFTELTGIRVNYSTYATNEELYSKLKSGYASYDVIIPSDYMVGRLADEGLLLEPDFGNIPNMRFIAERFINPLYDPLGMYSAPYTWGYVGIIFNRNKIFDEEEVDSWEILWDEKYLGQILMFSNSRDAFSIAQARLGYSMNTTDEHELYDCLEQLKIQKPLVQAYVMDEIFDKMLGGEAAIAPYYAGDALTMMAQNGELDFVIPKEGTNLFVDAMCIPRGSRQKEAAEMYINFMLEPSIGAANSEFIGYATPNEAAMGLLDDETRSDPIAYPDESELERAEYFAPLPPETSRLMDHLWTELLSADETYNRLLMPMALLFMLLFSIGINIYRVNKKQRALRNY